MNAPSHPQMDDNVTPVAPPAGLSRLNTKQKVALGLVPLALVAGIAFGRPGGTEANAAPPPVTVTAAQPLVRQVSEWDDYSGRFEASRSVEVRPRVSGAIVGVHFKDGSYVRQGQLLFTIDPRPFAASLAEARAAVFGRAQRAQPRAGRPVAGAAPAGGRCGVAQRCRPAAGAGAVGRGGAGRCRCAGPLAPARRRLHPGPRADQRADFGPADRCGQPRHRRRRGAGDAADHHQRARPDVFHLRCVRSAVPQGAARAGEWRGAERGADPASGRDRLSLARAARFHRQRARHAVGDDPASRGDRQSAAIS